LVFCLFPAITEEIAFRGLIQYWLEVSLTPMKALLLGSAMFAGLHLAPLSFPYLFTVGATLAIVRRRTGSLYPGMLIHFLHNLVVITVFPLF
jgi:membrane protease YdiL (CAAX protease family)